MTRLALLIGLGVLGLVAVLMLPARSAHLLVSDAVAVPMQDGPMLMVSLTVRNDGPPEQVTGVSSPGAEVAMIANPGVVAAPIIVPGDGTGVFAVDGAHIMVHAQSADLGDGSFVPVTLHFASGASVSTRARVSRSAMMDHSLEFGEEARPAPQVDLRVLNADASGVLLDVDVANLDLVRRDDAAPHVAGEGHGHVYLNGLKLARLYAPRFQIGALPSGTYEVSVALNTNDHRPFVVDDQPVTAAVSVTIDP